MSPSPKGGLAAALLAAWLAGCTVTPDYHPPNIDLPARWNAAPQVADSANTAGIPWWTAFNDPVLNSLIERVAHANPDLQLAEARLREARARRGVASAALAPTLDAKASYARQRDSLNAPGPVRVGPDGQIEPRTGQPEDLFQAGFDATWEIDIFGGRRRAVEAAQAEQDAAAHERGAVLLTLLAEVARNYIDLRGLQQQTATAQEQVAAQQDLLKLTRARNIGGLASDLDVARVEISVKELAAQLPALETSTLAAEHRLGILLGQPPAALLDELRATRPIPAAAAELPVGLPSDLLRQRPDLRRAERQLAAASARLGVATADLYPRFSLLATAGLASATAGDFFSPASRAWSIGPSVVWPIFRGGQLKATIEVRDAQQQQALIAYRQAILKALEDVENAVTAYTRERERRIALADALGTSQKAVDLARGLYRSGLTDFRDVLAAQRQLYQARNALAQSDAAVAANQVALFKTLGGGWEAESLPKTATMTRPEDCPSNSSDGEAKCSTWP